MKKIIILIMTSVLLMSCSISTSSINEPVINIFDKHEDLAVDYYLKDNIILGEDITVEKYNEAALIYDTGSIVKLPFKDSISISRLKGLKGIYLYNDFFSITDAYYDAESSLENNERVILVLLDGFSLNQYKHALSKGYINFLQNYYKNEAVSVYTPVTNAGYAAIITGKTPDINGIHDRSNREMKVDSIFQYALENDKKSVILEGDIKILNTEIEPMLHIDLNKDGDTDDEMFESTLTALKEDYDLIFVHFHGIDDRGHSFGPYSDEAMNYISKIDSWIEQLSEIWEGKIILTADHGMHETLEGGSHGECQQADMVVPYFVIN